MREEGEQSRAGSKVSTKEDQEIRKSSFSLQKEENGTPNGFMSAVKSTQEFRELS